MNWFLQEEYKPQHLYQSWGRLDVKMAAATSGSYNCDKRQLQLQLHNGSGELYMHGVSYYSNKLSSSRIS